ncbi:hypothetical protein pb186bvf_008716 [Paramecium bursaria]
MIISRMHISNYNTLNSIIMINLNIFSQFSFLKQLGIEQQFEFFQYLSLKTKLLQMSEPKNSNFIVPLVGGVSNAINKTARAPIERIKILLQSQDAIKKIQDGGAKKYTGMVNCFSRVYREEGVSAFWRGNLASVLKYFPSQALMFATKDKYKKWLCPYNPKTESIKFFLGNMASGGAAGATSLLFTYPLDFGRIRLAADIGKQDDRQFRGLLDCLKQISKSDGPFGLYRGFGVSVLGIIVYRGFYFGIYDTARSTLVNLNIQNSYLINFFIAYAVTVSAGLISYPLDTVRVRMMMQSGNLKYKISLGRADQMCKGTIHCFAKIKQQEGFKGFFKGAFTNLITGIGSTFILFILKFDMINIIQLFLDTLFYNYPKNYYIFSVQQAISL